jgi:hypothetical protein
MENQQQALSPDFLEKEYEIAIMAAIRSRILKFKEYQNAPTRLLAKKLFEEFQDTDRAVQAIDRCYSKIPSVRRESIRTKVMIILGKELTTE